MQVSVIIPALNESESIDAVLAAIPSSGDLEILVVDGGSHDGTAEIAAAAGARVICETRRGYGRACARGVEAAQGDIIVFMDADGADDGRLVLELAAPIASDQCDLVLGSRLAGEIEAGAMPWHQLAGNWIAARLLRLFYGLPLTDLSPFRAVQRERLIGLGMEEMTYGWPTEMIARAARRGWRIQEIPVSYHPRLGGKSKISGTWKGSLLATFFILRTILRYRWTARV